MRPLELLELLRGEAEEDKVLGGMTPRPPSDVLEVCRLYSWQNLGDPGSYKASARAASYIVSWAGREALGGEYPGWVTSGASEGNFLALYAARAAGYSRVVYFDSAHYSIPKSARILGMRQLRLPTTDSYMPRLDLLEEEVREGDVIVATVGTTETGFIDPVPRIAEIAARRGAIVHIDAAFAGPIMRHLPTGKTPTRLDDTVVSIVMDMHKIPEAPAGVGVLLFSRREMLESLYHEAPYIPSGRQFGVLGTRSGGPVAAAAYALAKLSEHGVGALARRLMEASMRLAGGLEEAGYTLPHGVETPILCLIHSSPSRVFARLETMGYKAYKCLQGRGVRMAIMPHLLPEIEEIGMLLARAGGRG